jgi:glycerol-3-phosphate dehydrogenase
MVPHARDVQDDSGRVSAVACEDRLSGERFEVSAKTFVNATGAFCDALRKCDPAAVGPVPYLT